ncbi:MAG: hypothetical protein KIT48_20080 [Pseudolabrys sp.]|nr:hypothetical protein [Pseudolabrys sp.]
MPDPQPLEPDQAAAIAKVRRLMLIASVTTVVAIGAVFGAIGYKVFKAGDSPGGAAGPGGPAAPGAIVEVSDTLPPGAKVLSTAVGEAQIVVTIDVGGATELRTYDPDTLKPLGRLRLTPQN